MKIHQKIDILVTVLAMILQVISQKHQAQRTIGKHWNRVLPATGMA